MTKAEEIFYKHLNSEDVKHIADKSFLMDRVLDAINEALNHKDVMKLGCSIGCSPQRNCQVFIELGGCEKCKFFKPTDL